MQIAAVTPATTTPTATATTAASAAPATQDTATSAFGLGFDSLLKIILTQLTYQDPLKPMDNFQFVSQLAQFSQIQIGQTTNDRLQAIATAQGNLQAANLLGRQVDIGSGNNVVTGKVTGIVFDNGSPRLTIETPDKQTISNIAVSSIAQIREGN